jgi:hypothetical protein
MTIALGEAAARAAKLANPTSVPENYLEVRTARRLARARRINAETHDRRVMLKIKLKDLAQEAKNIRREEQLRKGGWLRLELHDHRVGMRFEARATHLAYGFLRGLARGRMEPTRLCQPLRRLKPIDAQMLAEEAALVDRIRAMVKKYGSAGAAVPDTWFEE